MNWFGRLGALNWLLVGVFQWVAVAAMFGGETMRASSGISRVIYTLVGLSGLYCITFLFSDDRVRTD